MGEFAINDMQIGAADAAGVDADQNLARAGQKPEQSLS